MTPADLDQLARRANAAGFESIADYALVLEGALLGLLFEPEKVDAAVMEELAFAVLGRSSGGAS